jgi:uncharacterized protein YcfL
MKTKIIPFMTAVAGLLVAGCASTPHDTGPYMPQAVKTPSYENTERFVLLDPGAQYSVTCPVINERMLTGGRLEVVAQLRNRENRRIEIQAQCVFKDQNGFSIGEETPFQTVILSENATEQVQFASATDKAKKYTIRVRQAR